MAADPEPYPREPRDVARTALQRFLGTSWGRAEAIEIADRARAGRALLEPRLELGPDGNYTVLAPGLSAIVPADQPQAQAEAGGLAAAAAQA